MFLQFFFKFVNQVLSPPFSQTRKPMILHIGGCCVDRLAWRRKGGYAGELCEAVGEFVNAERIGMPS